MSSTTVAYPSTDTDQKASGHVAVLRGLIMAWFLIGGMINSGLLGPNRSAIERDFGLTHFGFGVLVAATQIVTSLAVLLASPLLHHLNRANLLPAGLGLQTVGFLIVWWSGSLAGLAVGWGLLVLGMVVGMLFNNVSMDLWPHNPRRGVILLHAFNGIGKVIGPALVGFLLVFGWRTSFLAVGGIAFAVFCAFLASRRSLSRLAKEEHAPSLVVLRRPFYWLCVLPFGMIAGGEIAFATLLPLYLEKARGFDPKIAALFLSLHLVGLVAGRFASAHLSHRLGNGSIIGLCLSAGVFALPAVLLESPPLIGLSLFLLGFQFSGTWPTFYAQVSRFLPGHRDALAYGSDLGNYVGISACVFVSSWIADHNLLMALLFGPGVLFAFALLYYLTPLSSRGEP